LEVDQMNGQPHFTTAQWPPEVPPLRPPVPPTHPVPPAPGPPPPPTRTLPSWDEPETRLAERDVADRLLEHRIIVVGGPLDGPLADRAAAQLLLLGRTRQPIELHLSCPDSELGPALALADAVDLAQAPVHALVRGLLRGPALAVLCAAERRTAHRNALFVLTVPDEPADGTAEALGSLAEQHRHLVAQLRARLGSATGRDDAAIAGDLESGRLLSAEEALAYGLVQELR
jgi:ATP-dependent Clp protease protease subunit